MRLSVWGGEDIKFKLKKAIVDLHFPKQEKSEKFELMGGILKEVARVWAQNVDAKQVVTLKAFQGFLLGLEKDFGFCLELMGHKDLILAGVYSVVPLILRGSPEEDVALKLEIIGGYLRTTSHYHRHNGDNVLIESLQVSINLVNVLFQKENQTEFFSRINTMVLRGLCKNGANLFKNPCDISSVIAALATILDPRIKGQNKYFYCLEKRLSPRFVALFEGIHDAVESNSQFHSQADQISNGLAVQVLSTINRLSSDLSFYQKDLLERLRRRPNVNDLIYYRLTLPIKN